MLSPMDRRIDWLTRALHRLHPRRGLEQLYTRVVEPVLRRYRLRWAGRHRSKRSAVFIGVTGSAAKTSTKDLVARVLSTRMPGRKSGGSANELPDVARAICKVREGDRFAVIEVGASRPGEMDPALALLRPQIGVVTNIGTDHYSAYGSSDAIAAEKRKLIEALPPDGTAVLNADDPRVLAMRKGFPGRVLTFGLQPDADVRAEAISAAWPARLAFTLVHHDHRVPVQTQLCGTHWVSSALAAVAVGLALGVPLDAAARALGEVPPFEGRMSPVSLPDGVTFIRDDWKASVHTISPALDFMKTAEAPRRIAIIGTIADTMGDAGAIYVTMARRALAAADQVYFVGPRAFAALRAKTHAGDDRLRAFATVKAASEFFKGFLRPGDLVLLKGSNTADHLYRIILARTLPVVCWQANCKKIRFCDTCSLLHIPSDAGSSATPALDSVEPVRTEGHEAAPSYVIVGLSNPGDRYQGTPHNVGQAVVDRLATVLGGTWAEDVDAHVSRTVWKEEGVCLVKPMTFVNHSGPVLARLAGRLGFDHAKCIVVYDDLDLPLGTVRTRMRGSDGGHRGMRSIIEAFQTDEIRRVKVGVKREGQVRAAGEAVLTPFTGDETTVMSKAYEQAIARLGELVGQRPGRSGAAPGAPLRQPDAV
jgi:UDP-N-acetylmuramoyl-tripeptide--D-alanyl-D-alanine ligase